MMGIYYPGQNIYVTYSAITCPEYPYEYIQYFIISDNLIPL